MKFLEQCSKKPKIFQRIFGLSFDELAKLSKKLERCWKQFEKERKSRPGRKRGIGGGHPYKFKLIKEKLAITLLYCKAYPTQELLGMIIGLDQANVSRLIRQMLTLIEKAADPDLLTYLAKAKEENSMKRRSADPLEFFNKYPELKDVSIDAFEQSCYRSKNKEVQKQYYSGKKKRHSLKTQLTVSSSGRILDVSHTYPGSVHDKKIIDTENTIQKLPKQTCQRLDSGYQGVVNANKEHYIITPIKKKKGKDLSPLDKELNHAHSKRRVIVENVISRIKKFRICSYLYRNPIDCYNQIVRNIAAILNFRLVNRNIIM